MADEAPFINRYVIVDVDVGCDDAWALFALLKAMDCGPHICNILAITCVSGNTSVENVARNVLRVLKTVKKERTIPVYCGAAKELIATEMLDRFHGHDGFQDLEWTDDMDMSIIRKEHAVNRLYELVRERPKEISLLCLGPLTNIALALRMYGDAFHRNIKDVHIMGGNHLGVGNTTKSAEFNFYMDSEAAQIVLDTLTCPITILPWEACMPPNLTIPMSWRTDVLGRIEHPILELLNPIEYKAFAKFSHYMPCDALVSAIFISPGIVTRATEWHATIETCGKHTRGQMVLDHLKKNLNNVRIVEQVDELQLKNILLWTCDQKRVNVKITNGVKPGDP